MDAQTIPFTHPATTISNTSANNAVMSPMCCPCNVCRWYFSPITSNFCYTLRCIVFHPLNFAAAIFLATFDATMVSVSIGLIALCCMGVPLLWFTMELIIAFSRIDLAFNYYLVENGTNFDESKEYLITLSLYLSGVPLCCCYNRQRNCIDLMIDRIKALFTNIEIYKYIVYHILVRLVISCITSWIVIVVVVNVALLGTPVWYIVDDTSFVNNQVVMAYNKECYWPENDGNNGIICRKDYVWIINTFPRALLVCMIALLVLPLSLKLNNYFAELNKKAAYCFYTFYYSNNIQVIKSSAPILSDKVRINSV